MRFLSMAALVLMGAAMNGCTSSELVNEQPESNDKIVTLTSTVGFDAASTKALADGGVKTFADGDQIAVIYKNTSGETVKAVSEAISSGAGTASATFKVTLTNPDNTKAIRYIYPAAMAKETVATDATIDDAGTVDFTNLDSQDGTLATLGNNLDLCTLDAANWSSGTLPTGTLANQLAILAITLKDSGSSNITSTITGMTVSDGTNTYKVNRTAATGPIYVAVRPTDDAAVTVTATVGAKHYSKSLTGKTYVKSNGYNVSWTLTTLADAFVVGNETVIQFGQTLTLSATFNSGSFGEVTKSGSTATIVTAASMVKDGDILDIIIQAYGQTGHMYIDTVNYTYSWSNSIVGSAIPALTSITIGGNSIMPLPTPAS